MTGLAAAPASRHQEKIVAEFRAGDGRVGGYHAGLPLLLLTTTGARSGQRHATPLTYLPDGDRYVVAAANAGAPASPAWYRNLVANRGVTVEVGPDTRTDKSAVEPTSSPDPYTRRATRPAHKRRSTPRAASPARPPPRAGATALTRLDNTQAAALWVMSQDGTVQYRTTLLDLRRHSDR